MKYLIAIICLLGAFSVITLIIIWPSPSLEEKDVVLTVNKSQFTTNMIEKFKNLRSSHHEDNKGFINSVIIEQLLIQEAKTQKIDKEPEFRDAIKNYYEQSLIKVLLDRKNRQIHDEVQEEEIDIFLSYFGKSITFSIAQGAGNQITPEINWDNSSTTTELFNNLSTTLQPILAGLQPGTTRAVFDTGNEWFAVRVEKIDDITKPGQTKVSREKVQSIIASHKREQQLNNWLNKLVSTADISTHEENN